MLGTLIFWFIVLAMLARYVKRAGARLRNLRIEAGEDLPPLERKALAGRRAPLLPFRRDDARYFLRALSRDQRRDVLGMRGWKYYVVASLATLYFSHSVYAYFADRPPNIRFSFAKPLEKPLEIADPCRKFAVGDGHILMIDHEGTLWGMGSGDRGQLGVEVVENQIRYQYTPISVPGLPGRVVCVDAGGGVSTAVMDDGSVWQWGSHKPIRRIPFSRDKKTEEEWADAYRTAFSPTRVPGLSQIQAVASAETSWLALDRSGGVFAWGRNRREPPGPHDPVFDGKVRQVTGLPVIRYIALGDPVHAAAIDEQGRLWQWRMACTRRSADCAALRPERSERVADVVKLSMTPGRMSALASDGTLWSWGSNQHGVLGTGGGKSSIPARTRIDEPVVDVAIAFSHSYALNAAGYVYGWGLKKAIAPFYWSVSHPTHVAGVRNAVRLDAEGVAFSTTFLARNGCYHRFSGTPPKPEWRATRARVEPGTYHPFNVVTVPIRRPDGKPLCLYSGQ